MSLRTSSTVQIIAYLWSFETSWNSQRMIKRLYAKSHVRERCFLFGPVLELNTFDIGYSDLNVSKIENYILAYIGS